MKQSDDKHRKELANLLKARFGTISDGFRFSFESTAGLDAIDLHALLQGNKDIDKHLQHAADRASTEGRKPLLFWKRSRRGWLVFVWSEEIAGLTFHATIRYGNWTVIGLQDFLDLSDEFFYPVA